MERQRFSNRNWEWRTSRTAASCGFTIADTLIALVVATTMMTISLPALIQLNKLITYNDYLYQDEIGIYQLQIKLATSVITDVSDDELLFYDNDNDYTLHLVNGKLLAQPGTVDFIHDIDDCCFELDDEIVMLKFYRNEKEYEYPIAYYQEE